MSDEMKVSKDQEFFVAALHVPAPGEDEKEATRVFYVAATSTFNHGDVD